MGRLLAIGDIHGCFNALTTLASAVPFHDDDELITLGDYVDRGPDAYAVLDWLIDRKRRGTFVPLLGNHEQMMLEARESANKLRRWIAEGGDTTLASYSPFSDAGRLVDVPESHWNFFENDCRDFHVSEHHLFVHGNVAPELPLEEQDSRVLRWEKFDFAAPHCSGKTMICGHTAQKTGRPFDKGFAICIDTWVYGHGWLTCLDVHTYEYWQANQAGETRHAMLR